MRSCPDAQALAAYESGELSGGHASAFEHHLAGCGACSAAMDVIRKTSSDASLLRDVFGESVGESTLGSWSGEGAANSSQPSTALAGSADAPVLFRGDEDGGTPWVVPDYERIQLCGEGAYGSVWAVRDRVGVYRALKILDMGRMRRAKVGCRESAALETYCRKVGRHPYLIDVYHVGVVGDQLYYTMELADNAVTHAPVRGGEFPSVYRPLTLRSILNRRRIHIDTAIEIARRLLRGLSKLHGLDLVHRDVKPANIVFVKHRPKLADIGMVTPGEESTVVIGTPRYMPPDRIMDRTADTFAMGKVLHNMIAGPHPATFPVLPDEFRYGSLKWDVGRVNDLIVRACSPDAASRYPTAADMLDELEACADFPFRTLFDDLGSSGSAPDTSEPRSSVAAQLLLATLRAIPWIAVAAVVVILGLRLR